MCKAAHLVQIWIWIGMVAPAVYVFTIWLVAKSPPAENRLSPAYTPPQRPPVPGLLRLISCAQEGVTIPNKRRRNLCASPRGTGSDRRFRRSFQQRRVTG